MDPRVVSFSELSTAQQCPLKHELAYVDRWFHPQPPDSALFKGKAWHSAMEAHYNVLMRAQRAKNKASEADCRLAVEQAIERNPDSIKDLIWWMYVGYVTRYGLDDDWKILAVEHPAEVALPNLDGTESEFRLKLKVDLIIRDVSTVSKHIKVVDHKSGKDLPKNKELELDDQFGLYTWALRRLGHKVLGQIYNAARTLRTVADQKSPGTQPLSERFDRIPLYRVDAELNEIAIEAGETARARYEQQRRMKEAGRRSPRATDPQTCNWKCDFKDACLMSRKGAPLVPFLRNTGFTQDFTRH